MSTDTAIAWTNHTFNIAHGCFKVSPGCANCYAETITQRRSPVKIWGPAGTTDRRTFGDHHWNEPLKWNRLAEKERVPHRVFTSSMCDVFEDHPTIARERAKLWDLIRQTRWLDWQILTKRADRIAANLPPDWGVAGWTNVWLGVSVENQDYADRRLPELLRVPAWVRFVSYEPALGPVTFAAYLAHLHWIIYGGESGPGFRPADVQWARDTRDECEDAGVAFFHKQSAAPRTEMGIELDGKIVRQYPRSAKRVDGRLL